MAWVESINNTIDKLDKEEIRSDFCCITRAILETNHKKQKTKTDERTTEEKFDTAISRK